MPMPLPRYTHCFLLIALLGALTATAAEKTVIEMAVRAGQLRYSVEAFTVKPGAEVEIRFHNNDHEMMHNIVICENTPKVLNDVGMAAVMLAEKAEAMKYVPEHASILFASDLVKADETITFAFTAPRAEGPYPYVCTLPGHFTSMRGVMRVSSQEEVADSPLYNLQYTHYTGLPKNANLDNFASFTEAKTGESESGLLDLMVGNPGEDPRATDRFALEYQGQLLIPQSGAYRFTLDMIGMVDISLGETTLLRNTSGRKTYVAHSEELELKRGIYPLSLRYLAYHGSVFRKRSLIANIKFVVKGPDGYQLMTRQMTQPVAAPSTLAVAAGEVYVYRSAVEGSGPASVHVGFANGLSCSFDTKTCLITQAWSGGFLDAAGDWNGRGGGGAKIIGERFYQVADNLPAFRVGDDTARVAFKGYRLGKTGAPTFHYLVDDMPASLTLAVREQTLLQSISLASGDRTAFYLHKGERRKLLPDGLEIEVAP
jgi:plastocyanin